MDHLEELLTSSRHAPLTSCICLSDGLEHDISQLSTTSLITLQLADRVPLRTFYDGLFRFPCAYSLRLYSQAGRVLQQLKSGEQIEPHGSTIINEPQDCDDEGAREKKLAYQLAFHAINYDKVLQQTLVDSGFVVGSGLTLRVEELAVVSVMLYDYQDRRFQMRAPAAEDWHLPGVWTLEQALFRHRTRLSAALARIRIIHDAASLPALLPAGLRSRQSSSKSLPVHCWINLNGARSSSNILQRLQQSLQQQQPLLVDCRLQPDPQFGDLLRFERGWRGTLEQTSVHRNRDIVIQEKSRCLPAYILVREVRRLLQQEPELRGSILHVGAGSGVTMAHVSSLLLVEDQPAITRCWISCLSVERRAHVVRQLRSMDVDQRVRVMRASRLADVRPRHLENVVAVLVTPETTLSALTNPVEWLVEEGGDINMLREMALDPDKVDLSEKISSLVTGQNELLLQALRLPNVRLVVYATHSLNRAENEEVVFGVVDDINRKQLQEWAALRDATKLQTEEPPAKPYQFQQLQCGDSDETIRGSEHQQMPFLVSNQTPDSSGVFIAAILKNTEFVRRGHRLVIEDAIAMGLLDGIAPGIDISTHRRKHKRRQSQRQGGNQKNRSRKNEAPESRVNNAPRQAAECSRNRGTSAGGNAREMAIQQRQTRTTRLRAEFNLRGSCSRGQSPRKHQPTGNSRDDFGVCGPISPISSRAVPEGRALSKYVESLDEDEEFKSGQPSLSSLQQTTRAAQDEEGHQSAGNTATTAALWFQQQVSHAQPQQSIESQKQTPRGATSSTSTSTYHLQVTPGGGYLQETLQDLREVDSVRRRAPELSALSRQSFNYQANGTYSDTNWSVSQLNVDGTDQLDQPDSVTSMLSRMDTLNNGNGRVRRRINTSKPDLLTAVNLPEARPMYYRNMYKSFCS